MNTPCNSWNMENITQFVSAFENENFAAMIPYNAQTHSSVRMKLTTETPRTFFCLFYTVTFCLL